MKMMMSSPYTTTGIIDTMSDEEKNIPIDEKPGMIKNPLKIPPVNRKNEMDYDIEVSYDDDYDIK